MRKPFFKKSHNAWYVDFHGKMVRLDEDKEKAFLKYHELMATNAPVASNDSVVTILNSFLDWCQKNRSERTYCWYRHFLSLFAKSIGTRLQVGSLKPHHMSSWLTQTDWNDTTKHNAVRAVVRAFNWAVKEGRLSENPLKGVERLAPKRREVFLKRDQFKIVIGQTANGCFRDYLTFLFETGARPQEVKLIESQHCDLEAKRIVLPASQAKGKKQVQQQMKCAGRISR